LPTLPQLCKRLPARRRFYEVRPSAKGLRCCGLAQVAPPPLGMDAAALNLMRFFSSPRLNGLYQGPCGKAPAGALCLGQSPSVRGTYLPLEGKLEPYP